MTRIAGWIHIISGAIESHSVLAIDKMVKQGLEFGCRNRITISTSEWSLKT